MLQAISRIGWRFYVGIFVVSCVTLAYQIIITRFFSVVLYYHFAFAAISLAMLGLTRGAIAVYAKLERYTPERAAAEFARHATWFAITGVGAMVFFLCAPLVLPQGMLVGLVPATTLAFIVPFTQSGICMTLLLTRLPYSGGGLYAADLIGAALGCLGVIFALLLLDPVSATLWLGAFAAAAGWNTIRSGDPQVARFASTVAAVLAVLAGIHTGLSASGQPHLGVSWAKGQQQTETLFERWNTYSRVRVRPYGEDKSFGWGLTHERPEQVEQYYLDIDADAATVITRFDGDFSQLGYLKDDVINAAYLVRPPESVAVVGVGGGRDVLSGLLFGAKSITGIEINPAIFEVLTDKFADFSGHLDQQPGVSLVNAEARSYINHSPDKYDLVQISLIDTWAATAAGGLALTENRLYTVEAWEDFYRALTPGGMLSVSRWYNPEDHRGEFYRLVAIGAEALQRIGVSATEMARHLVAVNVGGIVNVVTLPTALTDAEWQAARARLEGQGFTVLLGPDVAYDSVTSTILSGEADAAFFESMPQNVAPSTDDKPFFFYTARLADVALNPSMVSLGKDKAIVTTLIMVIGALAACVYYIGLPFVRLARKVPLATLTPPVVYFSAIGMGFMLIEVSQMQRLMVFLGHPVYGLAVVLFTMLLFSGIGSMTVGKGTPGPLAMTVRVAALIASLLVAGMLTQPVTEWARTEGTDIRVVVSVLLLAPPAFFMGMMFPLGLGVWRRSGDLLPFFWSANGITSVLASVLGMALSIEFGIANAYTIGSSFYVVCAVMLFVAGRERAGSGAVGRIAPPITS